MIRIGARAIPMTVAEVLAEPCAVVVWDMQEATAARALNVRAVLEAQAVILAAARQRDVPIVYAQHDSLPIVHQSRVALRRQLQSVNGEVDALPGHLGNQMGRGMPGWQIVPAVAPTDDDVVINKAGASLFTGTNFNQLLSTWKVDVIVIIGIATDRGVLATTRDALNHGVFPIVVSDAVAAYDAQEHEAGLDTLRRIGDVCTSDEVVRAWAARGTTRH